MNKHMNKVSVIIPVYNSVEYLPECIDSLKNQTYKNIELIFVDDASTDGSEKILEQVKNELPNVKLIKHKENKCAFVSRYDAFKVCTGDFITFLDSDDFLANDYIEKSLNEIVSQNADILFNDYLEFRKDDNRFNRVALFNLSKRKESNFNVDKNCFDFFMNSFSKDKSLIIWIKMINRSILDKIMNDISEFIEQADGISFGEDYIYSTIFSFYSNKLISFHGPLYFYRKHESQSTNMKTKEKFLKQLNSFFKSQEILKNFLIKKGVYDKYQQYLDNWEKINRDNFKNEAFRFKMIREFNEILRKRGFNRF